MITEKKLTLNDGREISRFTIKNSLGAYACILSLGATVQNIFVPDRSGNLRDVVLGYDEADRYLTDGGYYGACIGRNANRIRGGEFYIGQKKYILTKNEKGNQLHGGFLGFDKKIWNGEIYGDTLVLSYFSPDGEEGFPANLNVKVSYSFDDECNLKIEYCAVADGDTVVNLTNHSYFNLSGAGCGNVLDTYLKINAHSYTAADESVIPTGEIASVLGTALDFTEFKKIGNDILNPNLLFGGYDHNFCIDSTAEIAAEAYCEQSGISLSVKTDCQGVQLYTCNSKAEKAGKCGKIYGQFGAFCLETQAFPNAVNTKSFPSVILKAGDEYRRFTVYSFGVM